MLERLNGDEKGDAIVSVRGYEPIWTVFTPSYELKKVYFPEGKAAIGKREAVLFAKENYVFDIMGEIGQKAEEKIYEDIETDEAKEKAEEIDREKHIAESDKAWDEVAAEINAEVNRICAYLDGTDTKALKEAAWENKAGLLLAVTENYEMSIANKMRLAAVVVIWGAYVGIKIAIAHKNEEKINARDMVKNLIIGIVIIFVIAMGAPLLINGLSAWVG